MSIRILAGLAGLAVAVAAGAASAQVAGEARDLRATFSVTNGFNQTSTGEVSLPVHIYNYGNGSGRKVLVIPSNTAFAWDLTEGARPRIDCGIGGGGYLAVTTGTTLSCTISSGNGGARRDVQVTLR